jgi:hypothetical protein
VDTSTSSALVQCKATIKRKHPQLPRFVVVPIDVPRVWKVTSTITVTGTINGVPLGRRGLKPGGDGWFMDLPEPLCRKAKVDKGDRITLALRPVADPVPVELTNLLATEDALAAVWAAFTPGQRRRRAEWVASVKQARTRASRAGSLAIHLRSRR